MLVLVAVRLFERAGRRHRKQLETIAAAAQRMGDGDRDVGARCGPQRDRTRRRLARTARARPARPRSRARAVRLPGQPRPAQSIDRDRHLRGRVAARRALASACRAAADDRGRGLAPRRHGRRPARARPYARAGPAHPARPHGCSRGGRRCRRGSQSEGGAQARPAARAGRLRACAAGRTANAPGARQPPRQRDPPRGDRSPRRARLEARERSRGVGRGRWPWHRSRAAAAAVRCLRAGIGAQRRCRDGTLDGARDRRGARRRRQRPHVGRARVRASRCACH